MEDAGPCWLALLDSSIEHGSWALHVMASSDNSLAGSQLRWPMEEQRWPSALSKMHPKYIL